MDERKSMNEGWSLCNKTTKNTSYEKTLTCTFALVKSSKFKKTLWTSGLGLTFKLFYKLRMVFKFVHNKVWKLV